MGLGLGGLFDLRMRGWRRRRKGWKERMWEVDLSDVEGWVMRVAVVVAGGVTSFAESLHPGKPSCVSLLLCDCSTSMGEG